MEIECPTCSEVTIYNKVPFPMNSVSDVIKDRESFFGFLGINYFR